jgi:hypothetical protein
VATSIKLWRGYRIPQTAKTIAAATGMSQQEVQSKLSSIQTRVEAAKENPEQAAPQKQPATR